jgi:hypothetical protein
MNDNKPLDLVQLNDTIHLAGKPQPVYIGGNLVDTLATMRCSKSTHYRNTSKGTRILARRTGNPGDITCEKCKKIWAKTIPAKYIEG